MPTRPTPSAARASTVTNLLRLLELPRTVRELLEQRELDMGHARALLGHRIPGAASSSSPRRRANRVGACARPRRPSAGSPGRRAAPKSGKGAARPASDPNVRRLEADLARKLGAAVSIEHGPKGGRVVIRYNGLDELEGILAHIK